MSRLGSSIKEADLTMSHSRRDNPVFRSQFLNNSTQLDRNPQILQTFFHNHPLQKYQKDITYYRPVSYKEPRSNSLSRSYKIVDQQVKYGKPLTAEEFNRIISSKQIKPEIITYGLETKETFKLNQNVRIPVEVKREVQVKKSGWCCCGSTNEQKKALVQDYQ